MLRITVLSGARAGTRFESSAERIRVGRAPDNDLVLDPDGDLDASAHHAELRREGGQWWVIDLDSRNGVFALGPHGEQRFGRVGVSTALEIRLGPNGPRLALEVLGAPPPPLAMAGSDARPPGLRATKPAPIGGAAPLHEHVVGLVEQRRGRSTREIEALVDRNVAHATGRMRLIIGALTLVVLVAGAALVFLALRRRDPDALRKELEQLSMTDPRRKEIEKKLGESEGNHDDVGRSVYESNKAALFMLVAHHGTSFEHGGFCTAFAVKPRILASNAHCVRAAEDFEDQGADIYAHLNESSKKGKPWMFKIGRYKGHPDYRHNAQNITPDVGVFELEEDEASATVKIANAEELERLGTGDSLYVLGFPGRTMDEDSPVAVFMFSHVGRITDELGQRADKFSDAWLVQHEGQTTPGTSGSPIFDAEGHVVAINAGGLLEQNQQAVYKYAMRIDLLAAIDLDAPDTPTAPEPPPKKKPAKPKPKPKGVVEGPQ